MTSRYPGAEVWTITKRGKEKQKPVCVIHYNQYIGEVDKKYERPPSADVRSGEKEEIVQKATQHHSS
jgi:hypothetical protein